MNTVRIMIYDGHVVWFKAQWYISSFSCPRHMKFDMYQKYIPFNSVNIRYNINHTGEYIL